MCSVSLVKERQSHMAKGMKAGEVKNLGHHHNLAQGVGKIKELEI